MNVLNGPNYPARAEWTDVLSRASDSRKRIIGYVQTGYLGQIKTLTRLGSSDLADWVSQIQSDIDLWYR